MFAVFTTTYVLYAIYLMFLGLYDGLICQEYIRWELLDFVVVLVDAVTILSILHLHEKTYKSD